MAENIDAPKSTIFDDVFRTIAQKLPQLILPLINEVFHTSYEQQDITQLRNEHYEEFGKIITDSIFLIRGHRYHVECQSTADKHMALRMLKYENKIKAKRLSDKEADSIISDLMDMIRKAKKRSLSHFACTMHIWT